MARSVRKSATVAAVGKSFRVVESRMVDPTTLNIATDPSQPFYDPAHRHDLPISQPLMASIMEKGVVESIAVAEVDGKLWVIDGRQRTRHAVKAEVKLVPVNVCVVEGYDALDNALAVMELNRTAQGVADIDSARIAGELIAAGKDRQSVATAMGVTESKLDAFLALYKAPEVVKDAVAKGVISTSGAAIIANKPADVAEKIIADAVADRAAINAADPAKATKAPTGTASNLDLRQAAANAEGKELPASAQRNVTAKPAGPRTGALNKQELEALVAALQAAMVAVAADKAASVEYRAAVAALQYAVTGNPATLTGTILASVTLPAR